VSHPNSSDSTAGRGKNVVRVALTVSEAATALGMSEPTFRRLVVGELRVIHAGPRTTLVRVSELERWCERHEALDPPARRARSDEPRNARQTGAVIPHVVPHNTQIRMTTPRGIDYGSRRPQSDTTEGSKQCRALKYEKASGSDGIRHKT
jgi:excisionase family DNA binding protein